MLRKKNYFSLIEVIIATSLFAVLIFSTTSLFFRYQKLNAHLDKIRPKVFERTLFFEKMLDITASIDTSTITQSSPLYEEFLSFSFDNGFKDEEDFSGKATCTLYRTFEKELIYKITAENKREITRALLKGVYHFKPQVKDNTLYIAIEDKDHKKLNYTFLLPKPVKGTR